MLATEIEMWLRQRSKPHLYFSPAMPGNRKTHTGESRENRRLTKKKTTGASFPGRTPLSLRLFSMHMSREGVSSLVPRDRQHSALDLLAYSLPVGQQVRPRALPPNLTTRRSGRTNESKELNGFEVEVETQSASSGATISPRQYLSLSR